MQSPGQTDVLEIDGWIDRSISLKLEWLNHLGSIKLKTARFLIDAAERNRAKSSTLKLIESSSGNLGLALSSICAARGYAFTCVVDPNVNRQNLLAMRALGAHVVQVDRRDRNGGYLATRIEYIKDALQRDPELVWLNQYASPSNPDAHFNTTAPEILEARPNLTHLFIGTGTTGTLMGCAKYILARRPDVEIIAVDTVGSVTFGGAPGPRYLPGLGTSRRPEIFDPPPGVELQMIHEAEAVQACRWLAKRHGVLAGASTGSVLAAVRRWRDRMGPHPRVVAVSPDGGMSYLDTLYSDEWLNKAFGDSWNVPLSSFENQPAGDIV
ncbi:2,3-diaminopropionate biosynthesis protein SbnA [Xanthomonas oryzae pv. oryzicola]|uniref:2,3-diaminopropionate biosynthesis protein SbnA n=1 Tax=Xanthomonas oryzae TaxID=347 RepID=UPI000464FFD9|nr:2,3-diaminopropionate biosynthesis protein SbnA [Xanthomonas oryzae]AJQ87346.1 cysteine synthase [Xanthomonas oryzae pv. oryzicola]AKK63829.1 cysteine synthase [Xanthomonas oryzae pv. oryzicola]AKO01041.1 cysteine synthase [Xanthomonas oryzae pv. oryzicola]AKO04840.1 cysteine synthase [Xanthomonas oryzae pv. oryzicola]AKO08723.1 cysteine synthase [Xanthomonas oryzae pv. oryzicola]